MSAKEKFYVAADLLALPNDGQRYELTEGELSSTNPPSRKHALLSAELLTALRNHTKAHDLQHLSG